MRSDLDDIMNFILISLLIDVIFLVVLEMYCVLCSYSLPSSYQGFSTSGSLFKIPLVSRSGMCRIPITVRWLFEMVILAL